MLPREWGDGWLTILKAESGRRTWMGGMEVGGSRQRPAIKPSNFSPLRPHANYHIKPSRKSSYETQEGRPGLYNADGGRADFFYPLCLILYTDAPLPRGVVRKTNRPKKKPPQPPFVYLSPRSYRTERNLRGFPQPNAHAI